MGTPPHLPKISYDQLPLPPSLHQLMEGSLSPLVTSYNGASPSCENKSATVILIVNPLGYDFPRWPLSFFSPSPFLIFIAHSLTCVALVVSVIGRAG